MIYRRERLGGGANRRPGQVFMKIVFPETHFGRAGQQRRAALSNFRSNAILSTAAVADEDNLNLQAHIRALIRDTDVTADVRRATCICYLLRALSFYDSRCELLQFCIHLYNSQVFNNELLVNNFLLSRKMQMLCVCSYYAR